MIRKVEKIQKLLEKKKRHSLSNVIISDLLRYGKLQICLFIFIIITSMLTVITAHYARSLIVQRERLFLESNILDIEWRNLILEENVLGDHNRVEQLAIEKLKMHHAYSFPESILIQNKENITHEENG